jgi:hypothetical protein
MSSQSRVVAGARLILVLGSAAVGTLLLGPFQGAERVFLLTDKEAHALAFYVLTTLSFVAAPRMRRNDLALAAFALGLASEFAQACVGRDAGVNDVLADGLGVLLAWAPAHAESLRRLGRGGDAPRVTRGLRSPLPRREAARAPTRVRT